MATLILLPEELLEKVLTNISDKELLTIQRVCKTFRNTFKASPILGQDIFLKAPLPTSSNSPPVVNPFLQALGNRTFATHELTSRVYFMRIYVNAASTPLEICMQAWRVTRRGLGKLNVEGFTGEHATLSAEPARGCVYWSRHFRQTRRTSRDRG